MYREQINERKRPAGRAWIPITVTVETETLSHMVLKRDGKMKWTCRYQRSLRYSRLLRILLGTSIRDTSPYCTSSPNQTPSSKYRNQQASCVEEEKYRSSVSLVSYSTRFPTKVTSGVCMREVSQCFPQRLLTENK